MKKEPIYGFDEKDYLVEIQEDATKRSKEAK